MTHYSKKWNADFWTFEDPTSCIVGFVFKHRKSKKAAMIYFTIQEAAPSVRVHRTTGSWRRSSGGASTLTLWEFETDTPIDIENDAVFSNLEDVTPFD